MSRKTRFMIALALVAGIFGFRAWQQRAPDKNDATRKPIAAEPAPERKLGRIAFKPCTLSPPMGARDLPLECFPNAARRVQHPKNLHR